MLWRLILLFTVVPLVELWLLLWFSSVTSVAHTIVLVLATGVVGAALARHQGWQTWRSIQEQLGRGQLPAAAMLDGLMILVAGTLLITPGILTDLLGFALLVPPVRAVLRKWLGSRLKARSEVQFHTFGAGDANKPFEPDEHVIIDIESIGRPTEDDEEVG